MTGELDERMFGAIIRSMLDIARNSENHTWFLEKEDFTSGEFTANDWQRFLGDVAWMASQHPALHIESVIEVPAPDWRDADDSHRASSPPTIGSAFSVTWHGWPPSTLHCTSSRSSRCRRPIGGMPMIMRPPSTAIFYIFSMKSQMSCQTSKHHLTHLGGRKSTGMHHFS